nr:unnamed protein product [Callosobruchus chinensis]
MSNSRNLQLFTKTGKKIIGVAANYRALLKVLKRDIPKEPGIFIKPSTSYITEEGPILIPRDFSVNEEVELGVIIGKKAKHVPKEEAMNFVGGYCVALDMTATCRMVSI